MALHDSPSVLTDHCRVGAGNPPAPTVKLAWLFSQTVWSEGWEATLGIVRTVNVAEPE